MLDGQLLYVAYGGGRNGTAMLIGMQQRGIIPDLIGFADTGKRDAEKPLTYDHVDRFSEWLVAHGFPKINVVHYKAQKDETLEAECERKSTLPSIVFGFRSCSDKWKIRPQHRLVQEWAAGRKVVRAVGYHAGEGHRAAIFTEDEQYRNWYPLIEWGWDNTECLAVIERAGLMIPPKSACYFCPSSTKAEVIQLSQQYPHLYARAVEMERRALASGKLRAVKGLGRHWSWENVAGAPDHATGVEIPCVCFDE